MSKYAERTTVTPERRRQEIERTLARYGATRFGYLMEPERAAIACELHSRRLRFTVPLPNQRAYRTQSAWAQDVRQRWAALALVIKAKLEAVESGLGTLEDVFAADILLPTGYTVAETLHSEWEPIYRTGALPPLLGGVSDPQKIIALPPATPAKEAKDGR